MTPLANSKKPAPKGPTGPKTNPTGQAGPQAPPPSSGGGGIDWNPISWVSGAASWTASQINQASGWVDSEVGKAAGWTEGEIEKVGSDVASFVDKGLHGLEWLSLHIIGTMHDGLVDLSHVAGDIGRVAHAAYTWTSNAESWFVHHAEAALTTFEHDVVDPALHDVRTFATTAVHDVSTEVSRVDANVEHLAHGAVADATHWIGDAGSWFDNEFHTAWNLAYGDVIGPALHSATVAVDGLAPFLEFGVHDVIEAAELALKAASWLEWFAAHSFDDIEALFAGFSPSGTLASVEAGAIPPKGTRDAYTEVVDSFFKVK